MNYQTANLENKFLQGKVRQPLTSKTPRSTEGEREREREREKEREEERGRGEGKRKGEEQGRKAERAEKREKEREERGKRGEGERLRTRSQLLASSAIRDGPASR